MTPLPIINNRVMKRLLIFLLSFLVLSFSKAQSPDNWQILLNKRSIFKGNSDRSNPATIVKTKSLKMSDCLTIRYNTDNADIGWKRTFYVNDSVDQNIKTLHLNKQSGCVSFKVSALKEMIDKKRPVFIFTTSLPRDPSKAAVVRIRRVLLCKIDWN
jgi:hypothetical protein